MGGGVALFKLSLMGNDPTNAMILAVRERIGIPFWIVSIGVNFLFFIVEIVIGRKYIGVGTFVNWFGVGIFADAWNSLLTALFVFPEGIAGRLLVMFAGVLILSLSCALYQTADLGISPYDSISIVMAEKLPIPYFWCRIFTDASCAVVTFLLGGLLGIGTLVCAFGLGPFITFFTKHVALKLLPEQRPRE